jgi:GDPmannose 4,6-dehydratase
VRVLITGVAGQDGSYLADQLLADGHEVFGWVRSTTDCWRVDEAAGLQRMQVDLTDAKRVYAALEEVCPDHIYNLAAQSSVAASWAHPEHTFAVNADGALHLFSAARDIVPQARIFQASSCRAVGNPTSPYGKSKRQAHEAARRCRSAGQFIACGVLYNHESPRRGPGFVTSKICRSAAAGAKIRLGNLDARRDWGWAPDYVDAMVRMLAQAEPRDFVIASGKSHTVGELCGLAYGHVGLDWRDYATVDEALFRPADPDDVGDPSEIGKVLNWRPVVSFESMVRRMVDAA